MDCYLDTFSRTPLLMQLTDEETIEHSMSRRAVGWRADCLGDVGGFSPVWSHMYDIYPENIIKFGARDAWQKAPVSLEVCWVMQHWSGGHRSIVGSNEWGTDLYCGSSHFPRW